MITIPLWFLITLTMLSILFIMTMIIDYTTSDYKSDSYLFMMMVALLLLIVTPFELIYTLFQKLKKEEQ